MPAIEIKPGIFWVGVRDWERRQFDSLIPLPLGTTYNSYLVRGYDKTALIDTVNPGFESELIRNISEIMDPAGIDYLVMNHAEPDHAGGIPVVMKMAPRAKFIATAKGLDQARIYYKVPEDRVQGVKDGDSIDLGGCRLNFIEAPWLHWPETMFTYCAKEKTLFPCDFLGFHVASALYEDELDDMVGTAKNYFGEIMMPFRKMGAQALAKLEKLEIAMIAPSHGPIHRNPKPILDAYKRWTAGETRRKVILPYVSMWNSTGQMVEQMVETLLAEGVEVAQHNLAAADLGRLAGDLVDSRAIVFGTPTVLGGMHPNAIYGAHLLRALRPPLKYAVLLSSYGWSGGAMRQATEILGPMKLEVIGAHEVNGPPTREDLEKVAALGRKLAAKVKG